MSDKNIVISVHCKCQVWLFLINYEWFVFWTIKLDWLIKSLIWFSFVENHFHLFETAQNHLVLQTRCKLGELVLYYITFSSDSAYDVIWSIHIFRKIRRNGCNFKRKNGNSRPSNVLRGNVCVRKLILWVWAHWLLGVAHPLGCQHLWDSKLGLL